MKYKESYYDCVVIYDNRGIIFENENSQISFNNLKYNIFELLEDEIDIDNIEEIDIEQVINTDDKTGIALLHINKLIRAVKHLNNKMKSIKENG